MSDFATPWTVTCQALLSLEFSREEHWSGLHLLLQGIFPTQGSTLGHLHCRQILYQLSHKGSPNIHMKIHKPEDVNISMQITENTTFIFWGQNIMNYPIRYWKCKLYILKLCSESVSNNNKSFYSLETWSKLPATWSSGLITSICICLKVFFTAILIVIVSHSVVKLDTHANL